MLGELPRASWLGILISDDADYNTENNANDDVDENADHDANDEAVSTEEREHGWKKA